MKRHTSRWAKLKEKALSRKRQPLTQSPQGSWARLNNTEVLLLAVANWLEHEALPGEERSDKAEILVEAIHDWKESLKHGN